MAQNIEEMIAEYGRRYSPGIEPRKVKIIRCSRPGEWYEKMVGKIISVHYFATFGCFDTEGKWIDYYDVTFEL